MTEARQSQAQRCYGIADDTAALDCLKELVRESRRHGETCQPKLVILTQKGCPSCTQAEEKHRADIESGVVEVVDVHSPEGARIAKTNAIEFTPSILLLDCQNRLIEPETV